MKKTNNRFKLRITSVDKMKSYYQKPLKLKGNIKFINTKKSFNNTNILKIQNNQNKFSFKVSKPRLTFNKTVLSFPEKQKFTGVRLLNYKKNVNFDSKIKRANSVHYNNNKKENTSQRQEQNQNLYYSKKLKEIFNNEVEKVAYNKKDEDINGNASEIISEMNINDFMDKIKEKFNDIGKLIKINFVVDNDRIYEYEKNEHVILKIIENDLKENQGLEIKEFIFNDRKLNIYKSLKENNIENNSIIKIVI